MNNVQVKRIRDFGKVGFVLSIIAASITAFSWIIALACNIACASLPKDFIDIDFSGTAKISVDLSEGKGFLKAYDLEDSLYKAKEEIENGHLVLNFFETNELLVDTVDIEDSKISLNANGRFIDITNGNLSTLLLAVSIKLSLLLIVFGFMICLFECLRDCNSPFDNVVVKRLYMFAFSLLPWALFQPLADNMTNNWLYKRSGFNLSLDFSKLLIVAVVFVLCTIFKYGAKLQQESDETL